MSALPLSSWSQTWRSAYRSLAAALPRLAESHRPLIGGFAVCVDKKVDLHRLAPELARLTEPKAAAFLAELMDRAASGRGGEIRVDWPDGPAFLERFAESQGAVGGTSSQAAWALARLGAAFVLAIGDRSADRLAVLESGIRLVEPDGRLVAPAEVTPFGQGRPPHYIIDYTAGRPLPGFIPSRSTRVIARFADEDLERDPAFQTHVRSGAAADGVGLVSSPNTFPASDLPPILAELETALSEWRAGGVGFIHFELGDYNYPGTRDLAVARLAPHVTSMGLSLNELHGLTGDASAPLDRTLLSLARHLNLDRLAVHADEWAAAVTRDDPWLEVDALATGCLLASARAEAGWPVSHPALAADATLTQPPLPLVTRHPGGWSVVCCPAPYLAQPASTVGLGDTFTAGTLLIHAQTIRHPLLAARLATEGGAQTIRHPLLAARLATEGGAMPTE